MGGLYSLCYLPTDYDEWVNKTKINDDTDNTNELMNMF